MQFISILYVFMLKQITINNFVIFIKPFLAHFMKGYFKKKVFPQLKLIILINPQNIQFPTLLVLIS